MRLTAIFRIAVALVGVVVAIFLLALSLKFFPDAEAERLNARKSICENVAVQCCLAAQRNDTAMMQAILQALRSRNAEVLSGGLRRAGGVLHVAAGEHAALWSSADPGIPTAKAEVPIFNGKKPWGALEVVFAESDGTFWDRISPHFRAVTFVALVSFLAFLFYLRRMLQYLDPSAVVPDRVRQALDTLAEGVVIVDAKERIVLANRSFANNLGKEPDELQGRRVRNFSMKMESEEATASFPWLSSLRENLTQRGVLMSLSDAAQGERTFAVNSAPIIDADGKNRGALATFDDITDVERKNKKLQEMLSYVKNSRDEIRRQNELLTTMATCDALTGCFNRRYMFSHLEKIWNEGYRTSGRLGIIMLDIDHFKSVNDTHGHAKGDAVLQEVAARLQANIGSNMIVCRYGGEEFCVVLSEASLDDAAQIAERLRVAIADTPLADLKISSSFGVSASSCGASQPSDLLEQADKSLYFSKRNGRNRVTKYVDLPANFSVADKPAEKPRPETESTDIPFHAVTGLLAALSYRDARTADHSRRVADLCVLIGSGLLSQRDCYVLEVAALLHDIGKVGVPDAILLKPGPLTAEEWEVMHVHDRIGIEILNAAFSCAKLTEIVRSHHTRFEDGAATAQPPQLNAISLEGRILTIVDAYDAIVSDRVYRKGRSRDEAFAELRRCAGTQFDPEIVERLIKLVSEAPRRDQAHKLEISKSAALQIGLHIERLAEAVDLQDVKQLSAVADRLGKTAAHVGCDSLALSANNIAEIAAADPDLADIVSRTSELLDLCRSTQHAFLQSEAAQT